MFGGQLVKGLLRVCCSWGDRKIAKNVDTPGGFVLSRRERSDAPHGPENLGSTIHFHHRNITMEHFKESCVCERQQRRPLSPHVVQCVNMFRRKRERKREKEKTKTGSNKRERKGLTD